MRSTDTVTPARIREKLQMDIIKETIKNLQKRRFHAYYAKDGGEAKEQVLALIPPEKSVGIGGSMTIRGLGLYEALKERGNTVWSHWLGEETFTKAQFEGERTADIYLCSSNAVMAKGALVNTDGLGNRAAYMFHGPETVVLVCGKNKIVSGGYEEAIKRVKNIAAPQNVRRLGFTKNPCYGTGRCYDCYSQDRICSVTTIIEEPTKEPFAREYHIILVDQELGF